MENELKVIDNRIKEPEQNMSILEIAIRKNADLATIEKLMELQERHESREAKKAYHEAMAAFKANPPEIDKDKEVSYNATKFRHASLANVVSKISAGLSEHGLSAAWSTEQTDKQSIKVTCTVTHRLGHSESTSLSAAPDTSGAKNAIQAIGSTVSYLERYTILALTGLAAHDMDDDAQAAGVTFISTDQATEINDLINDTGADKDKFLKFINAKSVDDIPSASYAKAVTALKKKKGAK